MGDFIKVANTDDLESGKTKFVREAGTALLLVNVDGEIYALSDFCTHSKCYLHNGKLKGNVITCPCHFAQFDVTTGAVQRSPAKHPLTTYPVKVEGTRILVAS